VTEGRGGAPAFHYENRVLTYGDVFDLANRTGNALRALGVGLEDRVLMLCLDAPEFLATFWGAIKIGAVPIPVNTLMRASDYLYFLNDSRAKVAFLSAPLLTAAGPLPAQAPLPGPAPFAASTAGARPRRRRQGRQGGGEALRARVAVCLGVQRGAAA